MRYDNPELQSLLAAEYVIGALQGKARDRFEQLLISSQSLRTAVVNWETYFSLIDDDVVEPVNPSSQAWRGIETRLFAETRQTISRWWRSFALIAASLLAVLLLQWFDEPEFEELSLDYVAVLQSAEQQPIWSVSIRGQGKQLEAVALDVPELPTALDYELWLLAGEGDAPVSLGLLPRQGAVMRELALITFEGATALAVSREQKGGSITGSPTEGAVLYVAKLFPSST